MIKGWKYYNHALIPTCAPHEIPSLEELNNKDIWNSNNWGGHTPYLVRYTTDYDCEETNWWYISQTKPIEIEKISKYSRRDIHKGLRLFDCRKIDPKEYFKEMANITLACYKTYPFKYRPNTKLEELEERYKNYTFITYGAFFNGELVAFNAIEDFGSYYEMREEYFVPKHENNKVNKALFYYSLNDIKEDVKGGKYITNGQRNIVHETNFNEDLINKYGFEKIYCKLNVIYNPKIKLIVKLLYPFRKIVNKCDFNTFIHNVGSVLIYEEIIRQQNKL